MCSMIKRKEPFLRRLRRQWVIVIGKGRHSKSMNECNQWKNERNIGNRSPLKRVIDSQRRLAISEGESEWAQVSAKSREWHTRTEQEMKTTSGDFDRNYGHKRRSENTIQIWHNTRNMWFAAKETMRGMRAMRAMKAERRWCALCSHCARKLSEQISGKSAQELTFKTNLNYAVFETLFEWRQTKRTQNLFLNYFAVKQNEVFIRSDVQWHSLDAKCLGVNRQIWGPKTLTAKRFAKALWFVIITALNLLLH